MHFVTDISPPSLAYFCWFLFLDASNTDPSSSDFSGAELNGLVKAATSFAFSRHVKVETGATMSEGVSQMKVNMEDFENAMSEVRPAFGIADKELNEAVRFGIIHFSPSIKSIVNEGLLYANNVRRLNRLQRMSVLLVRTLVTPRCRLV